VLSQAFLLPCSLAPLLPVLPVRHNSQLHLGSAFELNILHGRGEYAGCRTVAGEHHARNRCWVRDRSGGRSLVRADVLIQIAMPGKLHGSLRIRIGVRPVSY